ncbi:MAG: CARDB domain-containing protein [Myxococcota bacterium]
MRLLGGTSPRARQGDGPWSPVLFSLIAGLASGQEAVDPHRYGEASVDPGSQQVGHGSFASDAPDERVHRFREWPHPPIDLIPVLPVPVAGDGPIHLGSTDANVGVSRDMDTGLLNVAAPATPGFVSADEGERSPFTGDSSPIFAGRFGPLFPIADPTADPWARNVKVVQRFVDSAGNSRWAQSSGVLIDPETVLTAGHVVFDHYNGLGWVQDIWVYPAWDGLGDPYDAARVIGNFGGAHATIASTFNGWTNDEDYDYDIATLQLDRAVGALTGWYGYSWGGSCSWHKNQVYAVASYPRGSCYDGRTMYAWSGEFDDCNDEELELDYRDDGCSTRSHAGMSGSGAWYASNGSRYVSAVHSHTHPNADEVDYTRLRSELVGSIGAAEDQARGDSVDLQLLRARYDATTVTAGQSIGSLGYVLTNPTNADPASETYRIEHYLSSNEIISSTDTLLGSATVTYDFDSLSTVSINSDLRYTIPLDTPTGQYSIGARIDFSDANMLNNNGSYWDAQQITVVGVSDIELSNVTITPATAEPGDSVDVSWQVRNNGGSASDGFGIEVRLSSNSSISSSDLLLRAVSSSTLTSGATRSESTVVVIPDSVSNGNWYIGVKALPSSDANASNNDAVVPMTVLGRPDVTPLSVSTGASAAQHGQTLPVNYTIANIGSTDSQMGTVDIYLSTNDFISRFDTLLGSESVPPLQPGQSSGGTRSYIVPDAIGTGERFIGAIVTSSGDADTSNDWLAGAPLQINAARLCADTNGDGIVSTVDYGAWTAALNTGSLLLCDQNRDGICSPSDLHAWISNFYLGLAGPRCP